MKELYLYSGIYDFAASALIQNIEDADGEDIVLRVNSGGGSVFAGWGIAKKLMEYDGKITVKVDGVAASMAAALLAFADVVEASDVSMIMLHQASGEADAKLLNTVNENLKKQLKSKIDNQAFKSINGVTVDAMFKGENKDYWMTASEAKKIGLVNKVVKLSTAEYDENKLMQIAAQLNGAIPNTSGSVTVNITASTEDKEDNSNSNQNNMTLEDFKAKHPEAYAAMKQEVSKEVAENAVKAERDRIGAWMKFMKVDPEAVDKGIKDGSNLVDNQTVMADLMIKMNSPEIQEKLKAESAESVKTDDKKETPTADGGGSEEFATLEAELDKELGIESKSEK